LCYECGRSISGFGKTGLCKSCCTKKQFTNPIKRKNHLEGQKRRWSSKEYKKSFCKLMKEVMNRPEIKQNVSDSSRGRKYPPEFGKAVSKRLRGKGNPNYGKKLSKETLRKMSETRKKLWKDKSYARRVGEALNLKPNILERLVHNLLEKLNMNYRYVGDYSFWIGGKNPDFVHNFSNKVIEVFGDYWHGKKFLGRSKEEEEQRRVQSFKKESFDCLVIWENELKDLSKLSKKILKFDRR